MLRRTRCLLLLQLVPTLWFCQDFVFGGKLLLSEEVLDMSYAWEKALDEVGWNLEAALWDRNSFCGVPFLANPATRALYPPSLLVRLLTPLSPEASYNWLILFHLWILGVGGAVWLRDHVRSLSAATLGGWLWSASGYVIVRTGEADPGFLFALAWIPWILHSLFKLERPYAIPILVGLGFLEVTAGRSDTTFYTVYFAAGLLGCRWILRLRSEVSRRSVRREVGSLLAATILALLVCAPQILPTLELQGRGVNRSGDPDFDFAATDSLYPPQFLLSLVPGCLDDSTEEVRGGWVTKRWKFWSKGGGFHEVYFYFGQGTLALALLGLLGGRGKERFYWAGLILGVCLLAMGRYFPAFRLFFDWAPGWDRFRVPPRVLLGTVPAVSYLAASGLDLFVRNETTSKKVLAICGAGFLAIGILFVVLTYSAPAFVEKYIVYSGDQRLIDLPQPQQERTENNMIGHFRHSVAWAFVWWVLPLGLAWAGLTGRLRRRFAGWGLALVILIDLCASNGKFMQGTSHEDWAKVGFPEDSLIAKHKEKEDRGRLLVLGSVLHYQRRDVHPWFFPGRLLAYDVEMTKGYAPFLLEDYVEAFQEITPEESTFNNGLLLYLFKIEAFVPEVFRWFDVSSILASEDLPPAYEKLEEKVYVGKRGFTSKLRLYENPYRHPRAFLYQPEPRTEFPSPNHDLGTVEIVESHPIRVELQADVKKESRLALLETWFPGWICRIDGSETTVEKVAKTFRSIAIPVGEHEVVFEYRPNSWRMGILLFGFGFLGWLATIGWSIRRS